MAQHDYVLDNATGAAFRVDLNAVLQAIITQNSGSSAPTVTKPYMFWASTGDNKLKQRNSADTAWVDICELNVPIAKAGANSDITSLTAAAVTVAADDKVLIQDTSAGDILKSVTTQSIADLPIISQTKTIGYGTGAGFEYTQTVSKSTDFTINRPCGRITTHNSAIAAGASVSFFVNNSVMGSYNAVVLTGKAYSGNYRIECTNSTTGGFGVRITNITAGSLSQAIVIDFAVIGVVVS